MTRSPNGTRTPPREDPAGRARNVAGWTSGFNVVSGLWLVFAPFGLRYGHDERAMWNDVLVGLAVTAFAAIRAAGLVKHPWPAWLNMLLGAWLVVCPWILGHADDPVAMWNDAIMGVLIFALAAASAFLDPSRRSASDGS